MTIKEREKIIFERWSMSRPGFIADGIVDEESYLASYPKLMFVLKEVNKHDKGEQNPKDFDLRDFLRKGARPQTWNNVARWVKGIRNLSEDIEWRLVNEMSEQDRCELLKSICAINLKKSPGGYVADKNLLSKVAVEDKDYLNQQFSLYNPDLVICCGSTVSYLFDNLILVPNKSEWKTTRRGILFHEYEGKKYVIKYSHPETRVTDCLLFYGVVDAVREIYSQSLNGTCEKIFQPA